MRIQNSWRHEMRPATPEEERPTEDDIARRKLGPRGVPGGQDYAKMTPQQEKNMPQNRRLRRPHCLIAQNVSLVPRDAQESMTGKNARSGASKCQSVLIIGAIGLRSVQSEGAGGRLSTLRDRQRRYLKLPRCLRTALRTTLLPMQRALSTRVSTDKANPINAMQRSR
jgi:hypothetical protein